VPASQHQQGVHQKVDKSTRDDEAEDEEEAYLTRMKNVADQFGDDEELEGRQQKAKSAAANARPPDVVLEHANDSYTQRFCE